MPGTGSTLLFFSTLSHPTRAFCAVSFTDEYALRVGVYTYSPNAVDGDSLAIYN